MNTYLFEIVSFFKPIAPKSPSPQLSELFELFCKYLAKFSKGSRAFELVSSNLWPQHMSNPHIIANFGSVLCLMHKKKKMPKLNQLP